MGQLKKGRKCLHNHFKNQVFGTLEKSQSSKQILVTLNTHATTHFKSLQIFLSPNTARGEWW